MYVCGCVYVCECMYVYVCLSVCRSVCLSVYVCLCMYVCVCMCVCMCVHVCMYVCMYLSIYLPVCLSVCLYVCMSVCLCVSVCCVCMYVCMCVFMSVCVTSNIDVKLLFLCLFIRREAWNPCLSGARDAHWTGTNEDASVSSVISMGTLIDLPAHSFSVMGRGSTQEPPGSFFLHYHCTVAAIYVGWRFNCRFLESGLGYVGFFRKTIIIFMKYNHEIYFRPNCLGWLHVTGLSSWWIYSKIQSCLVCALNNAPKN